MSSVTSESLYLDQLLSIRKAFDDYVAAYVAKFEATNDLKYLSRAQHADRCIPPIEEEILLVRESLSRSSHSA